MTRFSKLFKSYICQGFALPWKVIIEHGTFERFEREIRVKCPDINAAAHELIKKQEQFLKNKPSDNASTPPPLGEPSKHFEPPNFKDFPLLLAQILYRSTGHTKKDYYRRVRKTLVQKICRIFNKLVAAIFPKPKKRKETEKEAAVNKMSTTAIINVNDESSFMDEEQKERSDMSPKAALSSISINSVAGKAKKSLLYEAKAAKLSTNEEDVNDVTSEDEDYSTSLSADLVLGFVPTIRLGNLY